MVIAFSLHLITFHFGFMVLYLLAGGQGVTTTVGHELSAKFSEVHNEKHWISAMY